MAASSIPTAIAAIRDAPFGRIVLVAQPGDLLPGRLPTLLVAARLAAMLTDRDQPLAVGPLGREELERAGIELPDGAVGLAPAGDLPSWLSSATRTDDLVIVPIDERITSSLISLHDAERSVLAVAHNPGSESQLGGSTLTFPVGGSLGPS